MVSMEREITMLTSENASFHFRLKLNDNLGVMDILCKLPECSSLSFNFLSVITTLFLKIKRHSPLCESHVYSKNCITCIFERYLGEH